MLCCWETLESGRGAFVEKSGSAEGRFIELPPGAVARPSDPAAADGVSVEWERADGARMKVSGIATAHLERLAERFLFAGAGIRAES